MNNIWKLYKHTNKTNKKVYIGITSWNLEKRWNKGMGYKRCPYFYRAIQKYGWDNFEHEIIFENLSKEDALRLEIEYIQKYNSTNNKCGYNLSSGGGGANGLKASDKTREIMSRNNKGKNNPMYGKHHSEHAKKLMSKKKKGIPLSDVHKQHMSDSHTLENCWNARKVICIENSKVYETIQLASKDLGVADTKISAVCRGKRHTTGGYHFAYYEDYIGETI